MSMLGIATILLLTSTTGSYSLAGAVCAVILTAQAIAAPRIGRLTDGYGQGQVLRPVVLVHVAGLTGLLAAALLHAPHWTLFVSAIVAGAAFPPIGSLVRARWSALVGGTPQLKSAFSIEASIDELIYIVGPVLTTVLSATAHSSAGFIAGMLLTLFGGLAFAAQRRTQPAIVTTTGPRSSALRIPAVRVILAFCLALGTVLGSVEIAMVGFAEDQGRIVLAGPMVAAFSVGSLATGLLYGARKWQVSSIRRFLVAVGLLSIGTFPLLVASNLAQMTLASFVAGAAVAPTLIVAYEIVEMLVPSGEMTAGFAWVQTSLGVGLAIGAGSAAQVVEFVDGRTAFAVTVAAGLAAVLIVFPCGWILRSSTVDVTPVDALTPTELLTDEVGPASGNLPLASSKN